MTIPQEKGRSQSDGGELMEEAPTTPAGVYAIAEVVQAFQSRKTRLLTEEKVEAMVVKRSAKIAKRDPRMLNDIRAMIASIRQEPHGLGTEVLHGKSAFNRSQNSLVVQPQSGKEARFVSYS